MQTSRIVLALSSVAIIAACAQIQGLDGYENVACLGDCADGDVPGRPDATAEAAVVDSSMPAACTPECTGGTSCCTGTCVGLETEANCGSCGNACSPTETCTARACTVRLTGDGVDGPLNAAADMTLNAVAAKTANGNSGQKDVSVAEITGFAKDAIVLIHQSRGTNAGQYELATVANVDTAAKKLTMYRDLAHTYASNPVGNERAQVVRVPRYTTVSISAGATVSAPAWDGDKGGILAFKATGAVTIAGAIDMTGRGFRGFSHAAQCAASMRYFCANANDANGRPGESATGPSLADMAGTASANGSGGGGGNDGMDCAGGGGGGHGTAGTKGADGDGLTCRNSAQVGGAGAGTTGSSDLRAAIFIGGAGGEGGADEDGAFPGAGGNGGGIVWMDAQSVTVSGAIRANGAAGGAGVITMDPCGGSGTGMGGGGGGAGGAIRVRVVGMADLGTALVSATGAGGGSCGGVADRNGGTGGDGRIGVAGTSSGTTSPAPDKN